MGQEHTPTPWAKDTYGQLRGANGKCVDTKRLGLSQSLGGGDYPEAEANAAFIVRAVNSHDALLDLARQLIVAITEDRSIKGSDADWFIERATAIVAAASPATEESERT